MVRIRLRFDPQQVILEVRDHGQGFDNPGHWVELVRQGKLGLVSTLERVQSLNGSFHIETSRGSGMLARITMPCSGVPPARIHSMAVMTRP